MEQFDGSSMVRKFILQEGVVNGTLEDYIQNVIDQLGLIRPATQTDKRRLTVSMDNLRTIKRLARQMINSEANEPQ